MAQEQRAADRTLRELEKLYQPLIRNHMRLFAAFMKHGSDFECGFGIDHCCRREDGRYDGVDFPLPVFWVTGVRCFCQLREH